MKTIIALIVAGILAGCTSLPPEPQWVRPGKMIANQWESPSVGSGTLTITRDATIMGAACTMRTFLDGVPIADLNISQTITIYPPAGEHIASTQPLVTCMARPRGETSILILSDIVKRYRLSMPQGDPLIQPSAF